jgi:hypothetical protein
MPTFSGTQGLKEELPDYINNGTYTLHEGTLAQYKKNHYQYI